MADDKTDFMSQLGYLSMAARMKRLSDHIMHSARQFYRSEGIDIEPNWYLVFLLLKERKCMSITEMGEALHFAHPTVITLVRKMHSNGYLTFHSDPNDSRRQLVRLSEKAVDKLQLFEKMWHAAYESVRELFQGNGQFLAQLDELLAHYEETDFKTRTENALNHE